MGVFLVVLQRSLGTRPPDALAVEATAMFGQEKPPEPRAFEPQAPGTGPLSATFRAIARLILKIIASLSAKPGSESKGDAGLWG